MSEDQDLRMAGLYHHIDTLQAENARLREELENLVSAFVVERTAHGVKVSLGDNRSLIVALENARAALQGGEQGVERTMALLEANIIQTLKP